MSKKDDVRGDAVPEVRIEVAPVEVPTPPPDVIAVTVRAAFGGRLRDPIVKAFISCEERVHGTRKLAEAEWAQLFSDFTTAAR